MLVAEQARQTQLMGSYPSKLRVLGVFLVPALGLAVALVCTGFWVLGRDVHALANGQIPAEFLWRNLVIFLMGVPLIILLSVFVSCLLLTGMLMHQRRALAADMVQVLRCHGEFEGPSDTAFSDVYPMLKKRFETRAAEAAKADVRLGEMASGLETIGTALGRLNAGDLSYQITQQVDGEFKVVCDDFNRLVGALRQFRDEMGTCLKMSDQEALGLIDFADHLSRRATQQDAVMTETDKAFEQMGEGFCAIAGNAMQTEQCCAQTKTQARSGEDLNASTIDVVHEIQVMTKQIAQAIDIIEDIAFQTGLLSLNASVEAARAGNAGSGFSFVASEVRALAKRSSDSASAIQELIETTQNKVAYGAQLVGEMGGVVAAISQETTQIAERVKGIAGHASKQVNALSQVQSSLSALPLHMKQDVPLLAQSRQRGRSLQKQMSGLQSVVARLDIAKSIPSTSSQPRPVHRGISNDTRSATR